jgi:hypothetical protein
VLYLMANFVNDVARANKLRRRSIERECAGFDAGGAAAGAAARAGRGHPGLRRAAHHALADAYLKSGADRTAYQARSR